jgi:intracellular sulfur oxidation DsrE/DsrF family protein
MRALAVLFVVFALTGCASKPAAPASTGGVVANGGVVILVSQVPHLPVSLKTTQQMLAGHSADHVSVVVCGKALTAIERGSPQAALLDQAISQGVRVVACELSMHKLGVKKTDLEPGVVSVPNGLLEVIRLQRLGYASVEI